MDSADLDALEDKARAKLSPAASCVCGRRSRRRDHARRDVAAWRRLRLRPRMLNDITAIDTGVSVFGASA